MKRVIWNELLPFATVALWAVIGAVSAQAAPMVSNFGGNSLVVLNDSLDFGPAGQQNLAVRLDVSDANFGSALFVQDTDGANNGNLFGGTSGPAFDENQNPTGNAASGGIPSANDEEVYFVYTSYNSPLGLQDGMLFATRTVTGGVPTGNGIAVDSLDGFGLGIPTVFGIGDQVGPGNNFTTATTTSANVPFSALANSSIFVPTEGGASLGLLPDPNGDDRFVDNNGGEQIGALGFFIDRPTGRHFGFVLVNELPGRNTLEILSYGIESSPETPITVTLGVDEPPQNIIPEPSTACLALSGMLLVVLPRQRRG